MDKQEEEEEEEEEGERRGFLVTVRPETGTGEEKEEAGRELCWEGEGN